MFFFISCKEEKYGLLKTCRIMRQVCEAVLYLHNQGLLHCGISSHAIHLTDSDVAKLGNFEYAVHKFALLSQGNYLVKAELTQSCSSFL